MAGPALMSLPITPEGLQLLSLHNHEDPYFRDDGTHSTASYDTADRLAGERMESPSSIINEKPKTGKASSLVNSGDSGGSAESAQLEIVKSDFVGKDPPSRKSARLTSSSLTLVRPPGLNLVPQGTSWSVDIFTRLNNAVRRSFIDLCNMIDAMQRRIKQLRTSDLALFFRWWQLFASFLSVSLDAYDRVLLPWIAPAAAKRHAASAGVTPPPSPPGSSDSAQQRPHWNATVDSLTVLQITVSTVVNSFETIQRQSTRRPPDETMVNIIKAVLDLSPLIKFFTDVENNGPQLVEQHFTESEVLKVDRKLMSFLHCTGAPSFRRMHLVLLARALAPHELPVWQRSISTFHRISFHVNKRKFKSSFVTIVNTLASI